MKTVATILSIIALFVGSLALTGFINEDVKEVDNKVETQEANEVVLSSAGFETVNDLEKPATLNTKATFWGNIFWARYIDDWAKASDLGVANPFSGLDTFEREESEYWVAGMECPITDTYIDSQTMNTDLKFSCMPEYLPEAAKHFDILTLANNHTDNMNEIDGFELTKEYLDKSGVEYFGHYDAKLDEICKVVWLDTSSDIETEEMYKIPVAMCGYHNVFRLPTAEELDVINEYSEHFITIVAPHMGSEYTEYPDQIKTDLYREYIDRGADVVIGDHPHTTQTVEVYNDKLIVYSLGNFIFDQQDNWNVTRAIGVGVDMSVDFDDNIEKWNGEYLDCESVVECLSLGELPDKVNAEFEFDMQVSDNSGKLTKKASEEDRATMYEKINWKVVEELNND